jgi:hypothetical protein
LISRDEAGENRKAQPLELFSLTGFSMEMALTAHRSTQRSLLAMTVGLAILRAVPAVAAPASAPAMNAEAQAHFDKGKRYFVAQSYAQAVVEFKAAYLADPQNDTIYALAQAERLAGDCKDAVNAYRQFEAAAAGDTDADEQAKVANAQTMIGQCTSQGTNASSEPQLQPKTTNKKATTSSPPAPGPGRQVQGSATHSSPPPAPSHLPAYLVGAGGAALVAVGVTMGFLGQGSDHALHSMPPTPQQATDDANSAKLDYLLADILVPAGLLAGGLATYLWLGESSPSDVVVGATWLPGGAALTATGTWGGR